MGVLEDQFMYILSQQQAGQQLQHYQSRYSQRALAQAQQQAYMYQQQANALMQQQQINYASLYGASLSQYRPPNVFVPLTQDEVDMAEAMYEVNKIAPGLKEENQ
jgi:hypothetical protein